MEVKLEIRGILDNPVEIEFSEPPQFSAACCNCKKLSLKMFSDDCDSKHLFCNLCVYTQKVHCPAEKALLTENLTEDTKINAVIQTLTVYCIHKNDGCNHYGDLKDLKNHLDNICDHHPFRCKFCRQDIQRCKKDEHVAWCWEQYTFHEPCGEVIPNTNYKEHVQTCPALFAFCNLCNEYVPLKDVEHHLEHTCPALFAFCDLCNKYVPRKDLVHHLRACVNEFSNATQKNQHKDVMQKQELGKIEPAQEALRFYSNEEEIKKLKERIANLEKVIQESKKESEEQEMKLKQTVEELNTEIEQLKEENTALRKNMKESEQRISLENQFDEEKRRQEQTHAECEETIRKLREKVEKQDEEIEVLQIRLHENQNQNQDIQKQKVEERWKQNGEFEETIRKLKEQVEKQDEEIVVLQVKLNENQNQRQVIEKQTLEERRKN